MLWGCCLLHHHLWTCVLERESDGILESVPTGWSLDSTQATSSPALHGSLRPAFHTLVPWAASPYSPLLLPSTLGSQGVKIWEGSALLLLPPAPGRDLGGCTGRVMFGPTTPGTWGWGMMAAVPVLGWQHHCAYGVSPLLICKSGSELLLLQELQAPREARLWWAGAVSPRRVRLTSVPTSSFHHGPYKFCSQS